MIPKPPLFVIVLSTAFASVLITSCAGDKDLDSADGSDGGGEDTATQDGGSDGGTDGGSDGGTDGGTTVEEPAYEVGDLVITELMVDSLDVADENGEWVEVYNTTDRTLTLDGLIFGDDGVDAWPLKGNIQVEPGAWLVLCADADAATNGGRSCGGTFHYNTWGEGFALSNEGDEVLLKTAEGLVIDRMSYVDTQISPGDSLALDAGTLDATGNDEAGAWCAQSTLTPGEANLEC